MIKSLIIIIVLFTASICIANTKSKSSFTSSYTDMQRDCKNAFEEPNNKSDIPLICKAPKDYQVEVGYSACCELIKISNKIKFSFQTPIQPIGSYQKRKIEWRLANGKPFAVIFRINKYSGELSIDPKKTGEVLIVKGLDGFANIDYEVDVKKHSDPNKEARRLADKAYNF